MFSTSSLAESGAGGAGGSGPDRTKKNGAFGSATRSAELNAVSRFVSAAGRVPDRTAIVVDRGGSVERASYKELSQRAAACALALKRAGLSGGDRVVVMVPVSLDLYAIILSILSIGAVAVFVSPWLDRKHLESAVAEVAAKAYVGSASAQLLRLKSPALRRISVTFTTGRRICGLPARHSLAYRGPGDGQLSVQPVEENAPALISFTSGSSGVPKGANRTHSVLRGQHEALSAAFPVSDEDVDATMFPVTVLNSLASGVRSVVPKVDFRSTSRFDANGVLRLLTAERATTCALPPPALDALAAAALSRPESPPPIRRILCGGAPVYDRQIPRWTDAFPETEIVIAYGSTEAEPVAHIVAPDRLDAVSDVRPDSPGICVGEPTPSVDVRIIRIYAGPIDLSAAGWPEWEVTRGEIGEIVVAGPHVCRDYFRNPDAVRETKIVEPSGLVWHRMGDTGYIDERGRLWLAGRVHSTIVRNGEAVHPQLLEQAALSANASIARVAAVGLTDESLGQRVVVVLEAGSSDEAADAVRSAVSTSRFPVDDVVVARDPLPLDPRHRSKIDYEALRARLDVDEREKRGASPR